MFNLVVEDVTKTFREGRETVSVLKGATLRVAPGEVLALEGPSGSGKTTLLSIAGCLLSATSGKVEIAGSAVDASRSASLQAVRRRHIGFVFQQFNLFPALSALENVEYALNLKGVLDDAATDQARELIERVGLADRARFLPRDRAGKSNASPSRARFRLRRRWSWQTSRPPTSTPASRSRSWICFES